MLSMKISELADAFADVANLRVQNRTLNTRIKEAELELNRLRAMTKRQKKRLAKIKANPDNVLDHEDESRLYHHGVKFRFGSHINGTKILKVSAPGYVKSYPGQLEDDSSLLKIALEDLRNRAQ